ncbi:hypothetical protein PRZ48_002172 [Zasmidium cellare]|uniref:Uncharacterized protein n=1 Tax=Zasmidium cellare TaxID=395010 RepID=A0ABR0F399_ZASCE|nr:hypothetical protein PRZ48_002172 [Zasmidium cellare]
MDMVQDWVAYAMGDHAGAQMLPYARQAFSAISTIKSYLVPLIDQISQKPDLATIALLLIIVLVSLKLLDMLYQTVMFWARLAWRVVFWGGLVGLALWMYTRGPDGVADDMQYWFETWNGEYQKFKDQERVARLMHQRGGARRQANWY